MALLLTTTVGINLLLDLGKCCTFISHRLVLISKKKRVAFRWRDGYSDYGGGGSRGGGWGGRSNNSNYGGNRSQFDERGSYGGYRRRGGGSQGYQGGGGGRRDYGAGYWKDGVHHVGPRNPHVEKELFGTAEDKETTHTGINFDKYDNIPVEATGRDVPSSIEEVRMMV